MARSNFKNLAFICSFFLSTTLFAQESLGFKLFSGNANKELAEAISHHLQIPLSLAKVGKFNDGEVSVQIEESIRGCDIFIIQSTCPTSKSSVNDNLMELFFMVRAMKRASAKNITAVIPYYGYARQDRKFKSRIPISASDVAMLLELAGVDHVISVDLHCGQIQGFFHKAPVDNLFASTIFVPYIAAKQDLQNLVIVSPDAGGVERAKNFIEGLNSYGIETQLAVIVKQRKEAGVVETMDLVGNVQDCDVIIVDDMCDTAGTLVKAAQELKQKGAKRVFACITHPLFSGNALSKIERSSIDELIVTDTIPLRENPPHNITQLSISPLIAESINRAYKGESISHLFINLDRP